MEPPVSDFKRATLRPERCIGTANPTPAPLHCEAPRPADVQSNQLMSVRMAARRSSSRPSPAKTTWQ